MLLRGEFASGLLGAGFEKGEELLTAESRGDDDYFSSDLDDEWLKATFGRVDKPILLLPCGEDELVPPSVDRPGLLRRWVEACPEGLASPLSGFVPGANHVVSSPDAWVWIAESVVRFLKGLKA